MTQNELNFAYKVRNALNEDLANMPEAAAQRLAKSRTAALARKKCEPAVKARAHRRVLAGHAGNFFSHAESWFIRIGFAVPALFLAAGLFGIYHIEQQRRISDMAELDALVLSDELPLSAYVDHGFNAYLASRGE